MAAPINNMPVIALRGQQGVWIDKGPPMCGQPHEFLRNDSKQCRVMTFSKDGNLFAFCDGLRVYVVCMQSLKIVQQFAKPATHFLQFSPQGTLLATWEQYKTRPGQQQGDPNLNIWEVKTGQLLRAFIQKKNDGWCPQWSLDEGLCARNVNNEVHFFENNNFDTIANKLHLQKVADFKLPPKAVGTYNVAAYVPGAKAQPSFVRLFKYPHFGGPQTALANKSFFKADRVDLIWNNPGSAVLVLTASDTSAESYYGEQGLHYMNITGESCLVPRAKNGPVYSVEWHPQGEEFCVVYGFMPAKATIYNQKTEPVFDFGTGPRNMVYYNPFGNILCLAGFGNLQGNMEFWDTHSKKMISQVKAVDSTFFDWSPDGEHILTATCSPRLRVGNGYKLWHCTGSLLYEWHTPDAMELWEACFQSMPAGAFAAPRVHTGQMHKEAEPKKYVPPAMRGRPESELKSKYRQLDEEPPSNAKPPTENLSKAALKNKKKREAKKNRQQQEAAETTQVTTNYTTVTPGASDVVDTDPETEKKIRNVKKKLRQIEQLKEKQASGVQLELNQLDKLKSEDSLIQELLQLELG